MSSNEVECKILDHKSNYYEERVKNPSYPTGIKVPILPKFELKPGTATDGKYYYGVRIVTGSQLWSGGSAEYVYIKLSGGNKYSKVIHVGYYDWWFCRLFKSYFRQRSYDDLLIESSEELNVEVVTVGYHHWLWPSQLAHDWLVNFIQVFDLQKIQDPKTFPCYHWIGNPTIEASCTASTTLMKDVASNPILVKHRQDQVSKRKEIYQWLNFPITGYPSSFDDASAKLPPDQEFGTRKAVDFYGDAFVGLTVSAKTHFISKLLRLFHGNTGLPDVDDKSMTSLDEFEEFALRLRAKEKGEEYSPVDSDLVVYEGYRWVSDEEFGRQILNGVNPVVIRKCTALPDNFPVTEKMVGHLMTRGLTFAKEMEAGHIYICDLSDVFDGLECREGHYCPAPLCLLYVNNANKLVPIAIQLKKKPGEDNPIFLPTDYWLDWLLAKMYYRCADSQFHELVTHYLSTHSIMEGYSVATMRAFPDTHPLYKLLQRHFRYTIAVNSAARKLLISEGGVIARAFSIGFKGMTEIVKRACSIHQVQWTHIKKNAKERGVDDPEKLPNYHYRDDGFKIWDAIEAYVQDIIDIFYKSDTDVKEDPELKAWVMEVHKAFPAFNGNPEGRGFPTSITSKKELVDYCTLIIFTGTAQHGSINFAQFEIYAYVPNAPFAMRLPPPNEKGKIDIPTILNALPDDRSTLLSAALSYQLSLFSPDEIYLGDFPAYWFTDKAAQCAESKFIQSLKKIEQEIIDRNKSLDIRYEHFQPSHIPNSIAV